MPLHIGVVGCSAEGAALCYQTICKEGNDLFGPYTHPEVSIHTFSLASYVNCLQQKDWDGVAALMLLSAKKLAAAGANFLICPDNTVHQALSLVTPQSPLPWLSIADVVATEAAACKFKKTGVLGTAWLVNSPVYPNALAAKGIDFLLPTKNQCVTINRIIMNELVHGIFTIKSLQYFQKVITQLKYRGCDSVVLGCTEIPLIIHPHKTSLPTLDSTRLLARAALQKAVGPM